MASINTGGGGDQKGKPKKQVLRVDFTPMVDMNMLLITFFMFCTTLSRPQIMKIAMPSDQKVDETIAPKVKESKTITLLLGEDDKVYYYQGKVDENAYADYNTIKETTYSTRASNEGLRTLLLEKNLDTFKDIQDLKNEKAKRGSAMSDEEFNERKSKIQGSQDALTVILKPTKLASYKNLVDALDELEICSVGKYAIVDVSEGDEFLLENYKTKGQYAADNLAPSK